MSVLLTPECELWQSDKLIWDGAAFVLLTPECELWQSVDYIRDQAVSSC